MIHVTKSFLPPKAEYDKYVEGIWKNGWLTNNGPLVLELEQKLRSYLGLSHLLFLSNGTIAIQLAIKALGLKGKIITTPFSYVATTSTIVWEGCTPVFADIDPDTLNIDPAKIEALIDKDVTAILATHCFGNACDIDAIDRIAKKHGLKVIYDAAHCFGTTYKGKSIFAYGDVITTSFHATKLFHTTEGGAVMTNDPEVADKMSCMRSFGYKGPTDILSVGVNAKNSEFHAAMGLCNLKYVDAILSNRKKQSLYYTQLLKGAAIKEITIQEHCEFNYAYYPVIFQDEKTVVAVKSALEEKEVFTRRYFSPSLSSLNYVTHDPTPVCDDIASRILCLPVFHELSERDQEMIASVICSVLDKK